MSLELKSSDIATGRNSKPPLIFYLIMFLIPILFFVGLESGLRLAGYGKDYTLFTKSKGGVPGMLYLNPSRSHKYFSELKETVFFRGIGFNEEKMPGTFRIFVLGGSSAQGFPYSSNASFPRQLKRRLDLLYPETTIEVVNLGASAINSHTLLDILPEVLEQKPDLLLIYAGHNEYYGALGPASAQFVGNNRQFVRMMLRLRDFKTVELFRNVLSGFSTRKSDRSLMQQVIGKSQVPYDSDVYDLGIRQFEGNLREMLELITAARVPVVLGTLTSNLRDHPPFSSVGDQTDPALAFFNEGRNRFLSGDTIHARISFTKAKELDGLRFRAPEALNTTIRRLSTEYRVPLVALDSLFGARSMGGITGNELMCDHLHPNLGGYFLMSKGYFNVMAEKKMLPGQDPVPLSEKAQDSILMASFPFTYLDSTRAHNQLVYLLGEYPFVPDNMPNPRLSELRSARYTDQLSTAQDLDSARGLACKYYLQNGQEEAFRKEIEALISEFPEKEYPYLHAISLLTQSDLLGESYPIIHDVLMQQKKNASTLKMTGSYHTFTGNDQQAIEVYTAALARRPSDWEMWYSRGYNRSNTGDLKGALADYNKAIELNPDQVQAWHNRGVLKFDLRDFEGTLSDFDEVIVRNVSDPLPFLIRGYAKFNLKDRDGACEDWSKASSMGMKDAQILQKQHCN